MKIFIGLTEIVGYCRNLKKGFQELNVDSEFINLTPHPFKYGGDDTPNRLVSFVRYCGLKRVSTQKTNVFAKMFWIGLQTITRPILFVWALLRYDVFIFSFHTSFLKFYDLPILKMFNKKIIYMNFGTDSRPPYLGGPIMAAGTGVNIKQCVHLTREKKKDVRIIDKYADVIINYPPMAHFHRRKFVLGLMIGLPFSIENEKKHELETEKSSTNDSSNSVRILHSPSNPEVKGTVMIRQTIERLKQKGYKIDFVEITGQPNEIVLNELSKCDFIVDQLYSDTPLAGFATEAAFLGKPAVVGGYYSKVIQDDIPANAIPPSMYCHPDEIEVAIEKLIVDVDYRTSLGIEARKFVIDNWSSKKVAEKYLRLINGEIPIKWLYDPKQIKCVHGCGLPEERVKDIIKGIVALGSKEALQLRDKPELEKIMLEFANSE